jgi:hypothetical protein
MSSEASTSPGAGLLDRAVARYHEILAEGDTAQRSIETMREGFERANLIFGGRPLSPYLRPHFVTATDWDRVRGVCETIWSCVQKVGTAAPSDPAMLDELGLTDAERRLLAVDPGYEYISPTARLDSFLTDSTYEFVELNAECPAGIAYADVATEVFRSQPAMQAFMREYRVEPLFARHDMLEVLLRCWKLFAPTGGGGNPNIAVVDWEGLPTQAEFELFRDYFESQGFKTTIADPRALTYEGGRLRHGDFEIDIVYKRLLVNDFLEHIDELQALLKAYEDRAACVVNSFRGKYVHKKMFFGVLTNERWGHLFTADERQIIANHVPWTRRAAEGTTEYKGRVIDLVPFVRANRDRLVLKPNDEYGGAGVVIGWESDEAAWDAAIQAALEGDYLAQERVTTSREPFPALTDDGGYEVADQLVDLDPLLFFGEVKGAFTRLSTTSLCNVTSGGGMVPTFILK